MDNLTNVNNKNFTKINIELLVPDLLRITDADIQFPWGAIDSDTKAYFDGLVAEAQGKTMQSPATFALTLLRAKDGYPPAVGMMHFLKNVFNDLSNCLTTDEKKMACSIIKKILLTFNPTFYHFVGEIATLNNLMATKVYRLKHIEEGLPNGKSIDFYLHDIESGKRILVEVLNIDLDSDRVESDPGAIDKFIAGRAKKKFKEKNEDLDDPEQFELIPVLWGGHADIEVYRQHFKDHRATPANVVEPLAYLRHTDGGYYFDHQFGRVGNLIRKDTL